MAYKSDDPQNVQGLSLSDHIYALLEHSHLRKEHYNNPKLSLNMQKEKKISSNLNVSTV